MSHTKHLPLLYRAARDGAWGDYRTGEGWGIADALFVYLEGTPDADSVELLTRQYVNRPLVCLSAEWEEFLCKARPDARRYQRYSMIPRSAFDLGEEPALPEGFTVADFTEELFSRHAFSHGENYRDYADFQRNGAGAVVLHEGEIVASASSFLTHQGEVELDVSTLETFRRKGLAAACVRRMLEVCQQRGIPVHWDAQNEASRHIAEKFGYELDSVYTVCILPEGQEGADRDPKGARK